VVNNWLRYNSSSCSLVFLSRQQIAYHHIRIVRHAFTNALLIFLLLPCVFHEKSMEIYFQPFFATPLKTKAGIKYNQKSFIANNNNY